MYPLIFQGYAEKKTSYNKIHRLQHESVRVFDNFFVLTVLCRFYHFICSHYTFKVKCGKQALLT